MVILTKLKTEEVSLRTSSKGTVRFFLPNLPLSKKGFTPFQVLEEVVDRANKSGSNTWSACPRNVAFGNMISIKKIFMGVENDITLVKLLQDVEDMIKNKFVSGETITTSKLKTRSDEPTRKHLDVTNTATRHELDYFVCLGAVVKNEQADKSAEEKQSCNKYIYQETGQCPFLKYNVEKKCLQCTCKDFKSTPKGEIRH